MIPKIEKESQTVGDQSGIQKRKEKKCVLNFQGNLEEPEKVNSVKQELIHCLILYEFSFSISLKFLFQQLNFRNQIVSNSINDFIVVVASTRET